MYEYPRTSSPCLAREYAQISRHALVWGMLLTSKIAVDDCLMGAIAGRVRRVEPSSVGGKDVDVPDVQK